ncbi:MAG: PepSY-associated TM helix domain-containing protein [Planctomycetota bacterium]
MTFTLFNRRTHMYLGLFLAPWMIMYALSSLVFNHRDFFDAPYRGTSPWIKETEKTYKEAFPPDAGPEIMAEQILADLGLKGMFNAYQNREKTVLMINYFKFIKLRRITYDPADNNLLIERHRFRFSVFLRHLHLRRGYRPKFVLNNTWAFVVDVSIFAMFFWVFSGLWIWWKIKVTRRLGWLCILGGIILFVFFVLVI